VGELPNVANLGIASSCFHRRVFDFETLHLPAFLPSCLSLLYKLEQALCNTMDDHPDPLYQFFTPSESSQDNILYTTLNLKNDASQEEIRKSYRKLALKYHPDKHSTTSPTEKEKLGKEFQKVGFAYAVLSDEGRRKRWAFLT
jgi:DnaJ-domain-containing protein 1